MQFVLSNEFAQQKMIMSVPELDLNEVPITGRRKQKIHALKGRVFPSAARAVGNRNSLSRSMLHTYVFFFNVIVTSVSHLRYF